MKSASAGLAAHLAGDVTTLATCWLVTRRDGAVFGFTDHDRDLVVSGTTYRSAVGYQRAAISSRADLSVDETELTALLDDAAITVADVRAGLWDYAEVRIFLVNWADLSQGIMRLRRGRIGEVVANDDGTLRAELRGLSQALQQTVGEVYAAECGADLGDARCKVPLRPALRAASTAYAIGAVVRAAITGGAGSYVEGGVIFEATTGGTTGAGAPTWNGTIGATTTDGGVTWTARAAWTRPATVSSSPDRSTLVLSNDGIGGFANDWFDGGVAIIETGLNAGVARDVVGWVQSSRTLSLFLPLPYAIAAGDVLRIQPGCDKRLVTCRAKFSNRLNFRGHPHVPGTSTMIDTPG